MNSFRVYLAIFGPIIFCALIWVVLMAMMTSCHSFEHADIPDKFEQVPVRVTPIPEPTPEPTPDDSACEIENRRLKDELRGRDEPIDQDEEPLLLDCC